MLVILSFCLIVFHFVVFLQIRAKTDLILKRGVSTGKTQDIVTHIMYLLWILIATRHAQGAPYVSLLSLILFKNVAAKILFYYVSNISQHKKIGTAQTKMQYFHQRYMMKCRLQKKHQLNNQHFEQFDAAMTSWIHIYK